MRRAVFFCFAGLMAGWWLTGCESALMQSENQRLKAVREAQDRHFNDPDVARHMAQIALALHPEYDAAIEQAKHEGKKITSPRLLKSVSPKYPFSRRFKGIQGGVWIVFVIAADGTTADVDSLFDSEAIADPLFVEAAKAAVREWRFEPQKIEGQPIPAVVAVPVIFQLQ